LAKNWGYKGVVFCSKNALNLSTHICEFKIFSGVYFRTPLKEEGGGIGREEKEKRGKGKGEEGKEGRGGRGCAKGIKGEDALGRGPGRGRWGALWLCFAEGPRFLVTPLITADLSDE
jgi:hypothetical protein